MLENWYLEFFKVFIPFSLKFGYLEMQELAKSGPPLGLSIGE